MDLSIRESLFIIGVVLIVIILLDGYRRMRQARKNKVGMSMDKKAVHSGREPDYCSGELPNGGARVIEKDYDEEFEPESLIPSGRVGADSNVFSEEDLFGDQKQAQEVEEVIVINVMSGADTIFHGEPLFEIIKDCGLCLGDMDIFHWHQLEEGVEVAQFSMANMINPGTFDTDNSSQFSTPGVSFFVSLPGPKQALQTFENMLNVAIEVAEKMGGELKDEQLSDLTPQTIEHCRQRIRDFERRNMSQQSS